MHTILEKYKRIITIPDNGYPGWICSTLPYGLSVISLSYLCQRGNYSNGTMFWDDTKNADIDFAGPQQLQIAFDAGSTSPLATIITDAIVRNVVLPHMHWVFGRDYLHFEIYSDRTWTDEAAEALFFFMLCVQWHAPQASWEVNPNTMWDELIEPFPGDWATYCAEMLPKLDPTKSVAEGGCNFEL